MAALLINMICAFLATFSFCILFNIPKKCYILGGINGMFGWMCYYLGNEPTSPAAASFLGAVVITFCARVFASVKKCPATDFLIPGIIPLVPGAGIYYTAYYFVMNDMVQASAKGVESLKVAFAIVVGMVFIISLPGGWFHNPFRKRQIRGFQD